MLRTVGKRAALPAPAGTSGARITDSITGEQVPPRARSSPDRYRPNSQQSEIGATLDGGGVNTDTMLVLHIPAGGGRATPVSIPRDTWMGPDVVNTPGVTGPDQGDHQVHYLPGKINGFYGTAKYYDQQYLSWTGVSGAALQRQSDEAGLTMLIKVVQQFTGIKIDHYAEVNLLGFYLLSEAIGGTPVCLNNAVHDPESGAYFTQGPHVVEGGRRWSSSASDMACPAGISIGSSVSWPSWAPQPTRCSRSAGSDGLSMTFRAMHDKVDLFVSPAPFLMPARRVAARHWSGKAVKEEDRVRRDVPLFVMLVGA